MATGDSNDILARVKQLIPNRWFAYTAPIRDAVIGGLSDGAAWCYSWITYAASQARLATSTGPFLDLIAYDFLGRYLLRGGSNDHIFLAKIKATILQERVTRAGMVNAITALTGIPPTIFEPWNTNDAGAYYGPSSTSGSPIGYGVAGGWGSMQLPGQFFITVTRTAGSGIPNVAGYGNSIGGYGAGSIEYAGPSVELSGIADQDIYDVINTTRPTGTIAWTNII